MAGHTRTARAVAIVLTLTISLSLAAGGAPASADPIDARSTGPVWIYLSSDAAGTAGGVAYDDEDIVAWDNIDKTWSMVFDGSVAGLPAAVDLDAFVVIDKNAPSTSDILMSFDRPFPLAGFGRVDDSDILRFDGSTGAFTELVLDGSNHGLTKGVEDIDALTLAGGQLLVSTVGTATVPQTGGGTLTAADEDLIRFDDATGTWEQLFDGSDVSLTGEDIVGAFLDQANGTLYSAFRAGFVVPELRGDLDDVPRFTGTFGSTTSGTLTRFFNGDAHDFRNRQIDALDLGPLPLPQPTYDHCIHPAGGAVDNVDFRALKQSAFDASTLNSDGNPTFLRTVFDLPPERMRFGSKGLELAFDVGIAGPLDYEYRAELREKVTQQAIPSGTTQMYCMRFRVEQLPPLFGPVTIFQRFDLGSDGPDIEVELTGANQFGNAVPNDLQVVAWDGRHRIGLQLAEVNTLMVVVHNHAANGSYKVVLNGTTLREASGVDTIGSPEGSWSQFGLYPHGLYEDPNRQDQINSGVTSAQLEYADYTLVNYTTGSSNLDGFSVGP